MIDPLAEVVTLLQPVATLSKLVGGAGKWRLRRIDVGQPFYCVVLDGTCRLTAAGHAPIVLTKGDFVLIPAADDFTFESVAPPAADTYTEPVVTGDGEVRLGRAQGPADITILVGHCAFGSPDAALLVALLPQLVHVRGERRLATLVELVGDETRGSRPARDLVLTRLLEVLLMEALRSTTGMATSPGLLRGLADPRLAIAIRRIHENPAHNWTVAELAGDAALSRSTFFDRFRRAMGTAPMEYLLTWRMALAQTLLRRRETRIAEVARRVGYGSASAFSVAFTRHVGVSPGQYASRRDPRNGGASDARPAPTRRPRTVRCR